MLDACKAVSLQEADECIELLLLYCLAAGRPCKRCRGPVPLNFPALMLGHEQGCLGACAYSCMMLR